MSAHEHGWVKRLYSLLFFVAALGCALPAIRAAERGRPVNEEAARLVDTALQAEADGARLDRAALLQAALEQAPDYAPARWHAGYVRQGNDWVRYDRVPEELERNVNVVRYRNMRDDYPDTVAGQWKLATWCEKRRLDAEARAHLTRVLELDADHAAARARLGFRRINGLWVSRSELAEARQRTDQLAAALRTWNPTVSKLRTALASRHAANRARAREQIRAIDDEAAIPSLEALLCLHSGEAAQLVVEALGNMSGDEAAVALARQSVFSPWDFVRDDALYQLKGRQLDDFVPALLGGLYTPVQSRAALYQAPGGRLQYRHIIFREGQKRRELAVLDTNYVNQGGGELEALGNAAQLARAREAAVARQNAITRAQNERIFAVLSYTTEEQLPSTAQHWWAWWNEYNDVFVASEKPTQQFYSQDEVSVGGSGGETGGGMTMDCLAAGTRVWTAAGPRPIEEIRVGDRVLSQDPDTGELAYKPVLRTTVRPPGRLVSMRAGDETIETSGGHLFWQPGSGWIKSRDIKTGNRLHGIAGTAAVDEVIEGEVEPTYNLVVADFHTYFVGTARLLSHDNTLKEPCDAVVPGLEGR